MAEQNDLFGRAGRFDQLSLFGSGYDRLQAPQQIFTPDPETIRQRLNSLLSLVRESRVMPWSERDARMWQTVFPNMANWLPETEANQLRLAFVQEIDRLKAA
jgi:hypothetical protein